MQGAAMAGMRLRYRVGTHSADLAAIVVHDLAGAVAHHALHPKFVTLGGLVAH